MPATPYELTEDAHLLYSHADLEFNAEIPIKEVVFRYTNESNIKMYWVEGESLLRHINIMGELEQTFPVTKLNVISECNMQNINYLEELVGGYYTSGRLQYAYQLFNLDGSESLISPCSPLYSIFPNFEGANSREARGGKPEENCNKSFRVTISGLDSNFQAIRLIAIHYTDVVLEPTIRIVFEADFSGSTISIIDTGAVTLAEYTQAEFRTLNNRTVIPSTITTKDNRLIIGNVREDYFDVDEYIDGYWDARAYRWNDADKFKIDNTEYDEEDLEDIAEDADCIWVDDGDYLYRKDGTTVGGEGINISYKFIEKNIAIDEQGWTGDDNIELRYHGISKNSENLNYYDSVNKNLASYKRGETYRFAICFMDELGRVSFAKWIADIKIPRVVDSTITVIPVLEDKIVYSNNIYIEFTVNNVPTDLKYFIVRCKREEQDKSILAQGILTFLTDRYFADYSDTEIDPTTTQILNPRSKLSEDVIKHYEGVGADKYNSYRKLFSLLSPEISFNKVIKIPNNSTLLWHSTAESKSLDSYLENTIVQYGSSSVFRKVTEVYSNTLISPPNHASASFESNIIDNILMTDNSNIVYTIKVQNVLDSEMRTVTVINRAWGQYSGKTLGGKGSRLLVSTDKTFMYNPKSSTPSDIKDRFYLVDIIVDKAGKQYGGNSFSNRSINQYIKCSEIKENNQSVVEALSGDTYYQMFSYLNTTMFDHGGSPNLRNDIIHFPIETSYDLYNRTDLHPNSIFITSKINETISRGLEMDKDYPDYMTDLYTYNKVYSREADAQVYLSKPYYARYEKNFGNRVMISDKYLGIELSDPWLKFPFDQQTDVDSNHGQINKLINFRDNVLFFQDKAFGVIPINERRVLPGGTQEQSELTIGRGDLISDYKYLSERTGCQSPFAVLKTNAGIYWLDMITKRFNLWSEQGLIPLSDKLNVATVFNTYYYPDKEYLTKLLVGKGIQLSYNSKKNLVIASLLRCDTVLEPIVISYNEKIGVFQSKYTMYPYLLLNIGNSTLVVPQGDNSGVMDIEVHSLFKGDYGEYFGTDVDFKLTKISSDNSLFRKVYSNIEYNSVVVDNGSDVSDETISKIRVFNSYQTSKTTELVSDEDDLTDDNQMVKRRNRTWRTSIPRDYKDEARMIDYYLGMDLTYENNNNKFFRLDDLIIAYNIPIT